MFPNKSQEQKKQDLLTLMRSQEVRANKKPFFRSLIAIIKAEYFKRKAEEDGIGKRELEIMGNIEQNKIDKNIK